MALCEIKHRVGDYFSFEHPVGSPIDEFDQYKALKALPGVFKRFLIIASMARIFESVSVF